MKHCVPNSKASFASSLPIGLDSKTWRYLEPIFAALHQAQHQTGRFKFYGYLAEVYRTYKEWKDLGISKRMARRVVKYFNVPHRKGTSPARTLVDATFPALNSKQKSRWSRALEFAALTNVTPDDLPKLFKNSSGIAGCARLATKRKPRIGTGMIGPKDLARDLIGDRNDSMLLTCCTYLDRPQLPAHVGPSYRGLARLPAPLSPPDISQSGKTPSDGA